MASSSQQQLELRPSASPAALERQRFWLLLICAILGVVGGYVGGGMGQEGSWQSLATRFAMPASAFVAAAVILRLIDVLQLARDVRAHAVRSGALSKEIRARLEMRFPGVSDRARTIDVATLVDRALGRDRRGRSWPEGNRDAGG